MHKHKMKLLGRWPDSKAKINTPQGSALTSEINSDVSGTPAAMPDALSKEGVTDHSANFVSHSHASNDVLLSDHPLPVLPVYSVTHNLLSRPVRGARECGDRPAGGGGGGAPAVGGHGSASGGQQPATQNVRFMSSRVTVGTDSVDQIFSQHNSLSSVDSERTCPGLGGGGAAGVLGGR